MRVLQRAVMQPVLLALAILSATSVGFADPAAADPTFQMPFPCGEAWHASTYSGHVYNAIDWNAYPGDLGRTLVASAAGTATSTGRAATATTSTSTAAAAGQHATPISRRLARTATSPRVSPSAMSATPATPTGLICTSR